MDEALAAAEINVEQAHVIVEAVDALPADLVDAETRDKAEAFLLREARDHDAKALRIMGRRLLEVAAPEARPTPRKPAGSRTRKPPPGRRRR